MSLNNDPYYNRAEVSNSELGALEKYWMPQSYIIDLESAFRFGSLLDAMITEDHLVDYFKNTVAGVKIEKAEFEKARQMKKVFFADSFCKSLAAQCEMQKVTIKHDWPIQYEGVEFKMDMRCKWDFFAPRIDLSGDLKTTASTTQKQFEDSIFHYNYDRQAALYMDLENKSNFIFIGISKVNLKIFKVIVKRGDATYNSGKAKYQELAFRYYYLFGDLKQAV
jgi:PDDEXK-like domain of unknown function (DUF3799)